ncbi:MAG: phosphoribosylformylglycinamidine synthase subunit PurL [Polyangiales bacterium]
MSAPGKRAAPSPMPGDPTTSPALAKDFGVTADEWKRLTETLGRLPTYAELGVVSVMWSEHCSYKSSRVHLRRLPTTGPRVVQGPGENAGAVDIGDGWCAVFKMESHNHPSFIAPYQGAATGVGGILRDVFTMGARPIASLNSLRFGRPDHPRTPELMRGVVAGIGGYGNCIGVPTVGGEVQFDASYDGNILVNAFTVGTARSKDLFFGLAKGIGNSVLYVGARTGRDGIHGATMASAEFDAASEKKLPTVQVGDPFMEKLLLEACLEIFAKNCLEGVQDMGAAGLTSSSVEMAARSGNGLELDLDAIPRRTRALSPYEMLLSESQERMLMVAKPGREHEVLEVCEKWGLDAAVVGKVTDTGRFICKATPGYDPFDDASAPKQPVTVVDLPIGLLTDDAPKYERPMSEPKAPAPLASNTVELGDEPARVERLLGFLASPNIGSRRWIWRQYDHVVRDGTVLGPGQSDAAVVRAFCEEGGEKFLALAVDCNGRHVELDAFQGAAMAVAECARNIVCSGGEPLGLTDCLNFASPEKPETMWRIAKAIDGIAAMCTNLDVPVVSGNVSLYNETDGRPILPTPTVAIVGQLRSVDDRVGIAFRAAGDSILELGPTSKGNLAGSEWQVQQDGKPLGTCVGIDLEMEKKVQALVLALAREHVLQSAHDVSDGGLFVCIAESAIAGHLGAHIEGAEKDLAPWLAEEPSRVVVSVRPENTTVVEELAAEHGVPCRRLGIVGGHRLTLDHVGTFGVDALVDAHASALRPIVGD